MQANPLISVITVSFNSAATLGRAIESVVAQDWPSVEYIIIDGASTDCSPKIIERFGSRLAQVVSEPDEGIYDAMNKGLALATGDIICFLNADDYYANPTMLSRVAAQMHQFNLDALLGDVVYFHEQRPDKILRHYRSDRFHPNRLSWGWMPAHPALFLSSAVVKRVGHFKTDYRIAGDFEFIVRAFHKHKLTYRHSPEVLVHMQTGGVSTSGLSAKFVLNWEVLRACRENGLNTNMWKILSKYPAKLLELFQK